jgi:hypothetical protein
MRRHHLASLLASGALAASLTGCGDDSSPAGQPTTTTVAAATPLGPDAVIDPGDGGRYEADLDPADFVEQIDNPYLPLLPGSRWVYEGESDGEAERIEVVVTDDRRAIAGIVATVVRDSVYVDGELVEDTYDWFAQDREGNVWYLGEDSNEYEDGVSVSREGSWEHGVDGAQAGIVMLADPAVGDAYRQELLPGEAEDLGEVLEVGVTVSTPVGDHEDVLVTEDWNPLEPEVVEHKWYAPGIGNVREEHVRGASGVVVLVEFTPGTAR